MANKIEGMFSVADSEKEKTVLLNVYQLYYVSVIL